MIEVAGFHPNQWFIDMNEMEWKKPIKSSPVSQFTKERLLKNMG